LKKYIKCNTFHAEFYSGVGSATTEVLTGFFNFQDGKYLDSVCLHAYPTDQFRKAFLKRLSILWPLRSREAEECLFMPLNDLTDYGAAGAIGSSVLTLVVGAITNAITSWN
jgi:hypothetical protein